MKSLNRKVASLRNSMMTKAVIGTSIISHKLSLESKEPILFCIGMQRTGTTSIGDFCEKQLGMRRRGYNVSKERRWTRAWYEGRLEEVFKDPVFLTGQMFDDDPWWCPGVYQVLAERFPGAKFVMFKRPVESWFRSLLAHSNGRSPGYTDIHARIYGLEEVWRGSLEYGSDISCSGRHGIELKLFEQHYKRFYLNYINNVERYFANYGQDRLFTSDLDDPEKFRKLARFLGYADLDYQEVHSNLIASKGDSQNEG